MKGNDAWLVFLLRLGGTATLLAFFAIFLPTSLMIYVHDLIGIGSFPDQPLTQYLTRSAAALYAMHGGLLWVLSFDVANYRKVIAYVGLSTTLFGAVMIGIDLFAGLPWFWIFMEGPPLMVIGSLTFMANRQ